MMQELIGNLTVEQFTKFIGMLLGCVLGILILSAFVTAFIFSVIDGWLFRKGALYYGSLRYLNKCFKKVKAASTKRELDFADNELRSTIYLLRYQRIIPKIMFERLLVKQKRIYQVVFSELFPF